MSNEVCYDCKDTGTILKEGKFGGGYPCHCVIGRRKEEETNKPKLTIKDDDNKIKPTAEVGKLPQGYYEPDVTKQYADKQLSVHSLDARIKALESGGIVEAAVKEVVYVVEGLADRIAALEEENKSQHVLMEVLAKRAFPAQTFDQKGSLPERKELKLIKASTPEIFMTGANNNIPTCEKCLDGARECNTPGCWVYEKTHASSHTIYNPARVTLIPQQEKMSFEEFKRRAELWAMAVEKVDNLVEKGAKNSTIHQRQEETNKLLKQLYDDMGLCK